MINVQKDRVLFQKNEHNSPQTRANFPLKAALETKNEPY